MNSSTQLKEQAAQAEQDANYWAEVAAGHWGHSVYCRSIKDIDQAEVSEIRARAAEKSEQRCLFRAEAARVAARAIEDADKQFAAFTNFITRAA